MPETAPKFPRVHVQLTVHDIGRDPTATVKTEHADYRAARTALKREFGAQQVRGGVYSGTIGSKTGEVFQASKVWTIREVE